MLTSRETRKLSSTRSDKVPLQKIAFWKTCSRQYSLVAVHVANGLRQSHVPTCGSDSTHRFVKSLHDCIFGAGTTELR